MKVVTYKNGARWAEATTRTTGEPEKLLLAADRENIRANGDDLSFITVTVADKDDRQVPRSMNPIKFTITSGTGEIVAVDNGDPTSFESFQANERKAFNGLALVIVRAKPGANGGFTLRAESENLAPAEIVIQAR